MSEQRRTRPYAGLRAVDAFPGVVRRTLASGERLTIVEIRIAPGAEVPEHTHPHEQAGHVASGRVHFRIGDEEFDLKPGDSYLIPGDVPHYARAVDEGHRDSAIGSAGAPPEERGTP